MTRQITRSQWLQLVGICTLAQHHNRMMQDLERAACVITGDEYNSGSHTGDAIWGGDSRTPAELLRLLEIHVVDDPPAAKGGE